MGELLIRRSITGLMQLAIAFDAGTITQFRCVCIWVLDSGARGTKQKQQQTPFAGVYGCGVFLQRCLVGVHRHAEIMRPRRDS